MRPGAEGEATYLRFPGVRFVPSDEELILDYLRAKLGGGNLPTALVQEADVYEEHPRELTRRLGKSVQGFWYVFSKRERKYPNGKRPSRSTGIDGRWKTVGQNLAIFAADEKTIIGRKCLLSYEVFVHDDIQSQGSKSSRPRLEKTEWKMFEFVAEDTNRPISSAPDSMRLNDWVLCRITRKAGAEEEDDDEDEAYEDEVGIEGFDDTDAEPLYDDGYLKDLELIEYYDHPEVWGSGQECGDHHENQFGATVDPDPMVNQFKVVADSDPVLKLSVVPTDPHPWDFLLFDEIDDILKPIDDTIDDIVKPIDGVVDDIVKPTDDAIDDIVKPTDDAGEDNTPPAPAAAPTANKTSAPATPSLK